MTMRDEAVMVAPEESTRRREAIARIFYLPIIAGIIYPFAEHLEFRPYPFSIVCLGLTGLVALAQGYTRLGRITLSGNLLVSIAFAFGVALSIFEGTGIHDVTLLVYPSTLMVSALLLTRRGYIIYCAGATVYLIALNFANIETLQLQPLNGHRIQDAIDVTILMIMSGIIIGLLTRRLDLSILELSGKNRAIAKSKEALEEREKHAQALLRLSDRLNRAETYEEVLDAALVEIRLILGYSNVFAFRWGDDSGQFRLIASRGGLSPASPDIASFGFFTAEGDEMLMKIAKSKDIIVVEDAETDPRTNNTTVRSLHVRTIVNIPMPHLDKTIGSLCTGTFGEEGIRIPTEVEKDFLHSLAGNVAVGINRIDLLAERNRAESEIRRTNQTLETQLRYSNAMNRLAEAIHSHDVPETLLAAMSRIIGETLRVDRSLIYDISFSRQEAAALCEWISPSKPDVQPTKDIYPLKYFNESVDYIRETKSWIESHAHAYHPTFRDDGSGIRLHEGMQIKSLLWYPFRFRDDGFFAIVLNQVAFDRQWQKEEIGFLEAVSGQVHLALEKIALLEQRHRSEERFHLMFVNHDAVMLLIEPLTGKITDANDAAAKFYGYPIDTLRSMTISDLNTLPIEELKARRIEALHERRNYFVFPHRLANGEVRTVEVHSSPITISGKPILFSIIHDVTERTVAEEALRKLSKAIEQSPVSVMITDTSGKIEYVNPKFIEVTGYSFEEAVGNSPNMLKSGLTPLETYRDLWEALDAGREWKGEFRNRKKNGDLFWEFAYLSPIKDAHGLVTHYLGIKENITQRKQLEDELLQSQKLQSIGTLAGGIAHDFNNLLGIIMGNTWLLQNAKAEGEEFNNRLETIQRAVDRGAALVRQLLTFARKSESKIESVRIADTIQEITKLLRETFPKTIAVEIDLPDDLPTIEADPTQIHQIFLNLCLNARDAMPSGGTLKLSAAVVDGHDIAEMFPAVTTDRYIVLHVADTGTGMDSAQKQRIFEPFYTTKEPGKGTGLGLAVVHSVVTHHKGFLEVETELGKGTEFIIYLPVRSIPEMNGAVDLPKKGELPTGSESVLLIEDEESMQRIVVDMLEAKGYTVLVAADGEDGIELFTKRQKEISAVITDIGMPRMPGDQVFVRIRAINPAVPVVLVSGYYDPSVRDKLQAAGAKYFIQKPYSSSILLGTLRTALDRK